MGCLCSKEASEVGNFENNVYEKEKEFDKFSVQLVAPIPSKKEDFAVEGLRRAVSKGGRNEGSGSGRSVSGRQAHKVGGNEVHSAPKAALQLNEGSGKKEKGEVKTVIVQRPGKGHHQRWLTMDMVGSERHPELSKIDSMPLDAEGEQIADGWPSWLTSVAGEAIKGWVPRRAESFEKLEKIGQGTYSSVYKARDLETGKIVAMKKVRFVNMDPESVRFMAREIYILRKLDHPNVMKLEGLVASRMSCSLYLVFEYMEHDLAGLASSPDIKFTESQIKCYMQQLLRGLEHCHSRGILHRDIKGSNLLIDNKGVLKIADFGLATFYQPDQKQPLTSRVVTLWYRAPELLLGATDYGVSVDLWSMGCILAELFAGKPIMPGRTEVEQMHKIFKLCGSPNEDYWEKTRLPLATSFKPQHRYKRCLAEAFKDFPSSALSLIDKLLSIEPGDRGSSASSLESEFFTTEPLPCQPLSLPSYPPSKEFDAKLRGEEARRQKADAVKGRGAESVRRGSINTKAAPSPEFNAQGQVSMQGQSNHKSCSQKYNPQEDCGSGFPIAPTRGASQKGYRHPSTMIHPIVVQSSSRTNSVESRTLRSHLAQAAAADLSISSLKSEGRVSAKEFTLEYIPKKNRIHYSGPLMPPGGNIEDMLKEHEKQIQQAVRKARGDKARTNTNNKDNGQLHYHIRTVR